MPTTTASKGGLRATATAKREKAAQRNPLPPRTAPDPEILSKVTRPSAKAVKESPAEEFARLNALPLSQQTKKVQARIRVLGNLPENCGPTPAQESAIEAKPPAKRAPRKPAATATPTAPESPPLPPVKADKYVAELTALGWVTGVTRLDGLVELVARRGDEALYLAWMKEAHVSGTSTYTFADRTVKVRNPAEAMRIAARKPDEAKANQAKVASNLQFRRKATGPTIRTVPFDLSNATDEEVINALEARRVSWHNQYRVVSETATVGDSKKISITIHDQGHRIVSFVDPEFGFRAFRLDHLEHVGRRVDLERIRQQIISSLSKDAKKNGKDS